MGVQRADGAKLIPNAGPLCAHRFGSVVTGGKCRAWVGEIKQIHQGLDSLGFSTSDVAARVQSNRSNPPALIDILLRVPTESIHVHSTTLAPPLPGW